MGMINLDSSRRTEKEKVLEAGKTLRDFAERYALRKNNEPGNQTLVSIVLLHVEEYDKVVAELQEKKSWD